MSRKTIGFIVAIVGGILALFQQTFGITLDPLAIAAGLGAILTYIFFEAKLDLAALAAQPGKWKDPKFWITAVSVILAAIEATFAVGIPVEVIVSILTVLVGMLFGKQLLAEELPY